MTLRSVSQMSDQGAEPTDFDGDGHLDLAGTGFGTTTVWVLPGIGAGRFAPVIRYTVDSSVEAATVADLDRDGRMDLVVAGGASNVWTLLNDGAGSFLPAVGFSAGDGPTDVIAARLDGSRSPDLAVTNFRSHNVSVLLNETISTERDCNGNGVLDECDIADGTSLDANGDGLPDECPLAPEGGGQVPGDQNQDGKVDLSDAVWILNHLFLGIFPELPCDGGTGKSPEPGALSVADFNGDRVIDLSDPVGVLNWLFLSGRPHALGMECIAIEGCEEVCAP